MGMELAYIIIGAVGVAVLAFVIRTLIKRSKTKPIPKEAEKVIAETRPEVLEIIKEKHGSRPIDMSQVQRKPLILENHEKEYFTAADLSQFLAAFGTEDEKWDLDQSGGVVNVGDLLVLLARFGQPQQDEPLDIIPAWNNFYNHAPASNPNTGFDLVPLVRDEGVSWNDIKEDCDVEWYFQGQLASENKDKMPFVEAVTNVGLCSGQFPVTCRITHNGYIYERTYCSHINLTEGEGWFELNPDMKDCELGCSIADVGNMFIGDFEKHEFLVNP